MDESLEKSLAALAPDKRLGGFLGGIENDYAHHPRPSDAIIKEKAARALEVEKDQATAVAFLQHQHQVRLDKAQSTKSWLVIGIYLAGLVADVIALLYVGNRLLSSIGLAPQEHIIYMFGALIAVFCWLMNCLANVLKK